MLEEKLSEDVVKLRPRKLRLGRNADRVLNKLLGNDGAAEHVTQNRRLRPNSDSINAIHCADCGQIEYITREYCRCGHYLEGQVMDEFLAWERTLHENHERLACIAEARHKPLLWISVAAIPFILWPLIYNLINTENLSLTVWLWAIPGFAILGLGVLIEKWVNAERDRSAHALQEASVEHFLVDRVVEAAH